MKTNTHSQIVNHFRFWGTILLTSVFILGVAVVQVWAWSGRDYCVEALDEAEVFIEWNATDSDRGIQFFWDGEPWRWMRIKNQSGRAVLDVIAQRNVRAQGLTEGFFESAEPEEGELPADAFFTRFPEGEYAFVGRTLAGCWLKGETELTHDLPAPPVLDLEFFPEISWEQPSGVAVIGYEIVVELVVVDGEGDDEEEYVYVDTATFPGNVNGFTVSSQFLDLIDAVAEAETLEELKVEIIAIEESGNKTITEEEVELEDLEP